ncbi:5'-nucleotidase C-terminal domain-containing protein [Aedoeadaptatus acetigenes]|uniref:5'-nucleotidase C-terminal domain-containing protein n=1 Tax=Aedoeadaptatus acetigenes TaxID=2981723 RepID=A0ABV1J6T3_9FIRM
MKRKFLSLALAMAMVLGVIAGPVSVFAAPAEETKTITLLHTNDVHGHMVAERGKDKKLTNIGYARVKTYADSIKNSVLLDAGDVTHGTALAGIENGKGVIDLMKAMGYKAMVPGNHDFNYGYQALVDFKNQAAPAKGSSEGFDILAANIIKNTGTNDFKGQTILDVDGVKVGIFGIATEETKVKSNPKNTEGITFLDPVEVARAQVKSLKDQKVDVIVMLAHVGIDDATVVKTTDIAEKVDGIDVIIDGHSHTKLDNGKVVNNTLIAQTGNYLKNLGEINITLRGKDVISKTAVLRDAAFFEKIEENKDIAKKLDDMYEANKTKLEREVGTTAVELDGVREHVRAQETNFGNMVADAMREAAKSDIAITNGGGIRESIPAGKIDMTQIWTAFPFGNTIMKIEITGADLLAALEYGVADAPAPQGKFPQVSGVSFKYDPKQEAGKRVFDVKVGDKALDLEKTYTLATNDFMAGGGDGYTMFAKGKKLGDYGMYTEVLEKYLAEHKNVNPKVEGRIVVEAKGEEKPVEPTPAPNAFTDIKGHWAEKFILSATEKGLFKGVSDTRFAPNSPITRGMLVSVLARIEGQDVKQTAANPFTDVKAGEWYENAVIWAANNKIVKGYEDNTFKPNQVVTREEMATILGRYIEGKKVPYTLDLKEPFADQKMISKWALEPIDIVRHTNLMQGRENNLFAPKASATRAELAKVMDALDEIVKSAKKVDEKSEAEKKAAEDKKAEAEKKAAEDKKAEAEKKAAEDKKAEADKKAAEDKKAEADKKAAEDKKADKKPAEDKKAVETEKKAA